MFAARDARVPYREADGGGSVACDSRPASEPHARRTDTQIPRTAAYTAAPRASDRSTFSGGGIMRSPRYALAIRSAIPFVVVASLVLSSSAGFAAPRVLWASSISFTNAVASSPVAGGGYPVPDGSNAPVPGTCGPLQLNSNRSESWIAVKPGT